jgi:hypothetical protein
LYQSFGGFFAKKMNAANSKLIPKAAGTKKTIPIETLGLAPREKYQNKINSRIINNASLRINFT